MNTFPTRLMDRSVLVASTALLATMLAMPASAQSTLVISAAQCQPLSQANLRICCDAVNRADFLTKEELASCVPTMTGSARTSGNAVDNAVDAVDAVDDGATSGVPTGQTSSLGTASVGSPAGVGSAGGGSAGGGSSAGVGSADAGSGHAGGGGNHGNGNGGGQGNNGYGNGGSDGSPNGMQDVTR